MVSKIDERKAEFLREYRILCEKHKMMACMFDTREGNLVFGVGDLSRNPEHLEQAMIEMQLEPVTILTEFIDT